MKPKDTFVQIADHLRNEYGVSNLLTIDQIKTGIDGLHVRNLLDEGQSYNKNIDARPKPVLGLTVEKWNQNLLGKTITISCDVEYSGFAHDDKQQNRFGFEIGTGNKNHIFHNYGVWSWPSSSNGKSHLSKTYKIDEQEITSIAANIYDQINGTELKITNLKFVINPIKDL